MRFIKNTRLLLVFLSVLISGCYYPPLGGRFDDVQSDYTYQIGPGDELDIFIWANPDFSKNVAVRPDGKITIPLAEDIYVMGRTPYQVARELEKVYKVFIRDPQVVVMVSNFQGVDSQQIRIVGQLGSNSGSNGGGSGGGNRGGSGGGNRGGGGGYNSNRYQGMSIPYEKGMTLLDVIIKIGSIGEFADGNRASIIRNVDGELKRFGIKMDDLVEDGDMSKNVTMLPGDILIIPEAYF